MSFWEFNTPASDSGEKTPPIHESDGPEPPDLLIDVRGMDPGAAARSVQETVLDMTINILGAEDLVAMKVSAGGPQDIADAQGVLNVSGDRLNQELLRSLTRRYGRNALRRLDALLRP